VSDSSTQRRARTRKSDPWYADGLRFECLPDCSACCTNHDAYAYVYLEGEDLAKLADSLELTRQEFKRRYTALDDGDLILRMDEPDCPFLEESRCSVYSARPRQCRTFPFWNESLASARAWRRLGEFCPGIDRGDLHELTQIRDLKHGTPGAQKASSEPDPGPEQA